MYGVSDLLSDVLASGLAGAGAGLSGWRSSTDHATHGSAQKALASLSRGSPDTPLTEALVRHAPGFDPARPYGVGPRFPVNVKDGPAVLQPLLNPTPGANHAEFSGLEPALKQEMQRLRTGPGGPAGPGFGDLAAGGSVLANALTAPGGHTFLAPLLGMLGSAGALSILNRYAPKQVYSPYARGGAAALGVLGSRLALRAMDALTDRAELPQTETAALHPGLP